MIRILHLYYDLLNLYGEQGNVLALINSFNNQNVEVSVDRLSVGDKINFKDYDLVFVGSGSEENLLVALNDIKNYKKDIKTYIDDNKYFIASGNSYLLFGDHLEKKDSKIDCLGLFDYYAKEDKKTAGECFMSLEGIDSPIVGFQNRSFLVNNNSNHLFKVIRGIADNLKSEYEGYREKNFIGTYTFGPLLIRNPLLNDLIVKDILLKNNLKFHEDKETTLYKAYFEYLKNFYE